MGNDAWNTGGTREIATTPDNGKSKLIEIYANTLKCSSLNLSEKVKFIEYVDTNNTLQLSSFLKHSENKESLLRWYNDKWLLYSNHNLHDHLNRYIFIILDISNRQTQTKFEMKILLH